MSAKYVDRKSAAAFLGIGVSTLDTWCRKKRVPHYRPSHKPQFVLAELDEWMQKTKIQPRT